MKRLLVLGIGNILMQDEGIGVHLVRYLEKHCHLPDGVDVLDGGTGSFHLMEYFDQYSVVLIVDAIMDGKVPGSFRLLEPRFSSDYPRTLTAHDIGLKDLLDSIYLQESEKRFYVFAISIKDSLETSTELSATLQSQIGALASELNRVISDILEKEKNRGLS